METVKSAQLDTFSLLIEDSVSLKLKNPVHHYHLQDQLETVLMEE
jgi:hypothetical protein